MNLADLPLLLSLDGPAPAAPSAGDSFLSTLPMMAAFALIFYFVWFRPQQKEVKEHQALVSTLQKGDRVVTRSGIHGKVHEARADTLVLELSPNNLMTIDRTAVARKVVDAAPAKAG